MRQPRSPGRAEFLSAVAIIAALGVVGAFFFLRPGTPDTAADPVTRRPGSEVSATTGSGSRAVDPSETASPTAEVTQPLQDFTSGLDLPGMGGKGQSSSLPKHRLDVRIYGSSGLGRVAYIIPTSPDKDRGTLVVTDTSWSLSTTVFGEPDYGAVFAQANVSGRPVTCEIRVDGKLTEKRSTEGPYGAMWCQG